MFPFLSYPNKPNDNLFIYNLHMIIFTKSPKSKLNSGIPATGTGQPTGNITAVGQQPDDQLVRPNIRGAQQGRSENGRMRKRMEEFCVLITGGKK